MKNNWILQEMFRWIVYFLFFQYIKKKWNFKIFAYLLRIEQRFVGLESTVLSRWHYRYVCLWLLKVSNLTSCSEPYICRRAAGYRTLYLWIRNPQLRPDLPLISSLNEIRTRIVSFARKCPIRWTMRLNLCDLSDSNRAFLGFNQTKYHCFQGHIFVPAKRFELLNPEGMDL